MSANISIVLRQSSKLLVQDFQLTMAVTISVQSPHTRTRSKGITPYFYEVDLDINVKPNTRNRSGKRTGFHRFSDEKIQHIAQPKSLLTSAVNELWQDMIAESDDEKDFVFSTKSPSNIETISKFIRQRSDVLGKRLNDDIMQRQKSNTMNEITSSLASISGNDFEGLLDEITTYEMNMNTVPEKHELDDTDDTLQSKLDSLQSHDVDRWLDEITEEYSADDEEQKQYVPFTILSKMNVISDISTIFHYIRQLGKGASCRVLKARHLQNNKLYAVKELSKQNKPIGLQQV